MYVWVGICEFYQFCCGIVIRLEISHYSILCGNRLERERESKREAVIRWIGIYHIRGEAKLKNIYNRIDTKFLRTWVGG